MTFFEFRERMLPLGCFHIRQVQIWEPDFDRTNLWRWCKSGWLIKLRNSFYTFPEFLQEADFSRYVANRIYSPSYISLHSALSFYGMIPEESADTTSISTLKTERFENALGAFTYQQVKPSLFFGYSPKTSVGGRTLLMASPEKALLDLLYLYPFYDSEAEMAELRLDDDFLHTQLDLKLLSDFSARIGSTALSRRLKIMLKTYQLV